MSNTIGIVNARNITDKEFFTDTKHVRAAAEALW